MTPNEFDALVAQGYNRIPVVCEVLADLDTPLSVYLKLVEGPFGFLFESVHGGEKWGRYSIIGLRPDILWRANGDQAAINRNPQDAHDAFESTGVVTLSSLRDLLDVSASDQPQELTPRAAGVFG